MVESVTKWLRVYCRLVSAICLVGALSGVWIIRNREALAVQMDGAAVAVGVLGVLLSFILIFLSLVHLAVATAPRAPWAWAITAVVLGLDLTTLVLWPFALPLLWMWLKQDVPIAYGRPPRGAK